MATHTVIDNGKTYTILESFYVFRYPDADAHVIIGVDFLDRRNTPLKEKLYSKPIRDFLPMLFSCWVTKCPTAWYFTCHIADANSLADLLEWKNVKLSKPTNIKRLTGYTKKEIFVPSMITGPHSVALECRKRGYLAIEYILRGKTYPTPMNAAQRVITTYGKALYKLVHDFMQGIFDTNFDENSEFLIPLLTKWIAAFRADLDLTESLSPKEQHNNFSSFFSKVKGHLDGQSIMFRFCNIVYPKIDGLPPFMSTVVIKMGNKNCWRTLADFRKYTKFASWLECYETSNRELIYVFKRDAVWTINKLTDSYRSATQAQWDARKLLYTAPALINSKDDIRRVILENRDSFSVLLANRGLRYKYEDVAHILFAADIIGSIVDLFKSIHKHGSSMLLRLIIHQIGYMVVDLNEWEVIQKRLEGAVQYKTKLAILNHGIYEMPHKILMEMDTSEMYSTIGIFAD